MPPSPAHPVHGHCDPRFAPVKEALGENLEEGEEVGAAVCIVVSGSQVVDIWGGHCDEERTLPWKRDTLVNAYSVGKGILSILALSLVEQGLLELDAPAARLWPEFAAEDKGAITLRELMSHRAGLPAVRKPLPEDAMLHWNIMTEALAAEAPFWWPSEGHGYHCNTFGFLVGELVRRASGVAVRDAVLQRLTAPLAADFHFGLAPQHHRRTASICGFGANSLPDLSQLVDFLPKSGDTERDLMIRNCYFNPRGLSGNGWVNTAPWREATFPSTNGHGTARAVAALYNAFLGADPRLKKLVGPGLRSEAVSIQSDGEDRILNRPSRFGLGFQLAQPSRPLGPNPASFGHFGYGGSLGFADPDAELAFAYLINRPGERWQTKRTERIIDALYSCLAS